MRINLLTAMLLGLIGIAGLLRQLLRIWWPEAGGDSELGLGLLLSAGFVVLAIGLYRRDARARSAMLGLCLAGLAQVVIQPLLFVYRYMHDPWLDEMGPVMTLPANMAAQYPWSAPFVQGFVPAVIFAVMMLALVGHVSRFLYRYYRRPLVIESFGEHALFRSNTRLGGINGFVMGTTLLFLVLILVSDRVVTMSFVPVAHAPEKVVRDAVVHWQFSRDGRSLAVAGKQGELYLVVLPSLHARRLPAQPYAIWDATSPVPSRVDQHFAPDHQLFISRDGVVAEIAGGERRSLRSISAQGVHPIGLSAEAGQFLAFNRALAQITAVGIEGDKPLYSVLATREAWLPPPRDSQLRGAVSRERSNDRGREMVYAVTEGAFSPDRRHYLYVFNRRLHILDVTSGSLVVHDATVDPQNDIVFSDDGNWAMVYARDDRDDREPGILYNLRTREVRDHEIGGRVHAFSVARDRVVFSDRNTITQASLKNPATVQWRVALPAGSSWAYDEKGQRLWVLRPDKPQVEFAETATLRGDASPVFNGISMQLAEGFGALRLSPDGQWLVLVQGARIELLQTGTATDLKPATTVIDLAKLKEK